MAQFESWLRLPYVVPALGVVGLLVAAALLYFVARFVVLVGVRRVVARSTTNWDDALVRNEVFLRLAHVPPALCVVWGIGLIPDLHPTLAILTQRVAVAFMVVISALSISAFLTAANEIYAADPERRHRPIKGYIQLVKLVAMIAGGAVAIATLAGSEVGALITALCHDGLDDGEPRFNGQFFFLDKDSLGLFHPLEVDQSRPTDGSRTVEALRHALESFEPHSLGPVYGG